MDEKKDENTRAVVGFAVGLLSVAMLVIAFLSVLFHSWGYDSGRASMKRDAVDKGYAEFYIENYEREWRWKELDESSDEVETGTKEKGK